MELCISNIKYKDASARIITVDHALQYEDGYIITLLDYTYKFLTIAEYDKLVAKDEISED